MNGSAEGTVNNIHDWQAGSTAIASPTLVEDADIHKSIDDIQWYLSQLPSQAQVGSEVGWEDVAGPTSFEDIRQERLFSQGSLWDGSTRSASGSKTRGIKRRRLPDVAAISQVPFQARQRALQEIGLCGSERGDFLADVEYLACEDKHCFAMEPIGKDARDYSGDLPRWEGFEVRVIEPPATSQRLKRSQYPTQDFPLGRQTGRSLHMIVASYPKMASPQSLESGFAMLIVGHKAKSTDQWVLLDLADFTGMTPATKTISNHAHFVANLDRCKNAENGKRIWGERTSHIKHEHRPAKPIRLEPRGPSHAFTNGQQYCLVVTLHNSQGKLLLDIDDAPCIAQSNPFFFHSHRKELTSHSQKLLEQFEKLSVAERTMLANSASSNHSRQMLLDNSYDTQRAAGVFISRKDDQLPSTACPLSDYNHDDSSASISPDYVLRLQAVAHYLGTRHANPDLTDDNARYLRTHNCQGAEGRYFNLGFGGMMAENQDWLNRNGISLKIIDAYNRIQILQHIMHTREYRSYWIICVGNVYPPEVMVDYKDANKVHCLLDRAGPETLILSDRIYPLARLAYCSKIPRSLFEQVFFIPYIKGFNDAGGNGTNEQPLHEEKFWLIIQAMFIEFFFYWTELRNVQACLRIQQRLLQDDKLLDDKFFGPDLMHRFE